MWHWNSLWAPAPGDPPAVDDPVLWQAPWSAEQALALQARTWEAFVSATHSWWAVLLSAWPAAAWAAAQPLQTATAGAEALIAEPAKPQARARTSPARRKPPRKSASRARP